VIETSTLVREEAATIPRCLIVVPCFNERNRLDPGVFLQFADVAPNVDFLFVNDGSTDGTKELLDRMVHQRVDRFMVLHLKKNSGKAEAVRCGMLHCARLGFAYVGYWDADLATPLAEILEFADHLEAHPKTLIILGARVRLLGRLIERRPLRHYLGRCFATLVSWQLGIPIYDTQCGAKLFRMGPEVQRLFELPFRSRWIFDVEILARFLRNHSKRDIGEVIHEIPLHQWMDIAGSKLRPRDFFIAACQLWMIRHERSQAGAGAREKPVALRRLYDRIRTKWSASVHGATPPERP